MKGICVIQKLSKALPRNFLITIYKSFVRPYLHHANVNYNKPNNESLRQKVERIQYNPAIAITGVIKEISFKALKFRR